MDKTETLKNLEELNTIHRKISCLEGNNQNIKRNIPNNLQKIKDIENHDYEEKRKSLAESYDTQIREEIHARFYRNYEHLFFAKVCMFVSPLILMFFYPLALLLLVPMVLIAKFCRGYSRLPYIFSFPTGIIIYSIFIRRRRKKLALEIKTKNAEIIKNKNLALLNFDKKVETVKAEDAKKITTLLEEINNYKKEIAENDIKINDLLESISKYDFISDELRAYKCNYLLNPIPELLSYFKNGRCDNLKEGINIFFAEENEEKKLQSDLASRQNALRQQEAANEALLKEQRRATSAAQEQARAAQKQAKYAEQAASSAAETARYQQKQAEHAADLARKLNN